MVNLQFGKRMSNYVVAPNRRSMVFSNFVKQNTLADSGSEIVNSLNKILDKKKLEPRYLLTFLSWQVPK